MYRYTILYLYTIQGHRREMSLDALRDVSLKQARELTTGWHSILREGRDPIRHTINKSVKQSSLFKRYCLRDF
ncbi:hypothetical protein [Bartonella massiliensis]|uniref:hypothetical protein n=1 Tax=Bartonella massiliensis TaxID=929795 RepID=UPI003CCC7C26